MMPSSFTWLDYSEHERQRMLDVIDLFSERSTVDELGLGTVRIVFADKLFSGTSTIQTRAKYFLFVPWVYQTFEGKRVSSQKFKKRSRKLEIELIFSLLDSDDLTGLIGRQSKEKLQRHASGVYWEGLHRWGIRKFDGSEPEYRRSLDGFYARCSVRSCPSWNRPGYCRWRDSKMVLAWRPGDCCSCCWISSQTDSNGSIRVRQWCGC